MAATRTSINAADTASDGAAETTINRRHGASELADRPGSTKLINEVKGTNMTAVATIKMPPPEIASGRSPDPRETPLTYAMLRQVLLDSGSIEEREAQKLDRAFRRLLNN
jgi:hypothetical protein